MLVMWARVVSLSWHAKQVVAIGDVTRVVGAASVIAPLELLKLKPEPYGTPARTYGEIWNCASGVVGLKVPVATVRNCFRSSAATEASELKSYVPGRWHVSHSFRMPGNLMSAYDSVVVEACHVNGTVRLAPAWIAWMKLIES